MPCVPWSQSNKSKFGVQSSNWDTIDLAFDLVSYAESREGDTRGIRSEAQFNQRGWFGLLSTPPRFDGQTEHTQAKQREARWFRDAKYVEAIIRDVRVGVECDNMKIGWVCWIWIHVVYRDGGDRQGWQPVAGSVQCEGLFGCYNGSVKASKPNVEINRKS